jgi:hypothetical protein
MDELSTTWYHRFQMNSGSDSVLTYLECLDACTNNAELVEQFNRLSGYRLGESAKRSPIQILIDETTEYDAVVQNRESTAFRQFALFVKEIVWDRLPPEDRQMSSWVPQGKLESFATA